MNEEQIKTVNDLIEYLRAQTDICEEVKNIELTLITGEHYVVLTWDDGSGKVIGGAYDMD